MTEAAAVTGSKQVRGQHTILSRQQAPLPTSQSAHGLKQSSSLGRLCCASACVCLTVEGGHIGRDSQQHCLAPHFSNVCKHTVALLLLLLLPALRLACRVHLAWTCVTAGAMRFAWLLWLSGMYCSPSVRPFTAAPGHLSTRQDMAHQLQPPAAAAALGF